MSENYKFFNHKNCEYFPCHKTNKPDEFNCLFCYCPLYALVLKIALIVYYLTIKTTMSILWVSLKILWKLLARIKIIYYRKRAASLLSIFTPYLVFNYVRNNFSLGVYI